MFALLFDICNQFVRKVCIKTRVGLLYVISFVDFSEEMCSLNITPHNNTIRSFLCLDTKFVKSGFQIFCLIVDRLFAVTLISSLICDRHL